MSSRGVPAAIVIAGACVGLGLYLGLRALPSAPQPAPPPPPAAAPLVLPAAVHAQAAAWLEAQRPHFLERCWKPTGAQGQARYTFTFAIDPQGREVGRGISEDRQALQAEVGTCLRGLVEPRLQIAPPGHSLSVELPFTLP